VARTLELDAIIQRLQNLPKWNIYRVLVDGTTQPWYEVDGRICADLVIREDQLVAQIEQLPIHILQWGRLTAQAKRVWEIAERHYRVWRDSRSLQIMEEAVGAGEKRPTKEFVDQTVRADPEYTKYYIEQERAEEAYNAASAVLEGFRAKKDLLRTFAIRYQEQGSPRLSI